jgi:hypothetical protein
LILRFLNHLNYWFCDYFFDTKGKLPGGNGTFDWKVLEKYPPANHFSERMELE